MNNAIVQGMTPEDRAVYDWAKQKKAALRKSRKGRENVRKGTEEILVRAAKNVVRDWATNNLAGSVRELDMAIEAYEEVRRTEA